MDIKEEKLILNTICFIGNRLAFRGSGDAIPRVRLGFVKLFDKIYSTRDLIGVLLRAKVRGESIYTVKLPESLADRKSELKELFCIRGSRLVFKKNNAKVPVYITVFNRKVTAKQLRELISSDDCVNM